MNPHDGSSSILPGFKILSYRARARKEEVRVNTAEGPNGETLTWSGHNICYCPVCKVLFSSVAAFDKHLKFPKRYPKGQRPRPKHDLTGLPRNDRGVYMSSVRPASSIPASNPPKS